MGLERRSLLTLPSAIIEPQKCIVEDLEVLSFENEEQMKFYSIWHETLVDRQRELNAANERERRIIRNENDRKTRQLIRWDRAALEETPPAASTGASVRLSGSSKKSSAAANAGSSNSSSSNNNKNNNNNNKSRHGSIKKGASIAAAAPNGSKATSSPANAKKKPKTKQANQPAPARLEASQDSGSSRDSPSPDLSFHQPIPPSVLAFINRMNTENSGKRSSNHQRQGSSRLPNGLTIINAYHHTGMGMVAPGKNLMKYKLTKLYNKYRGRQLRRNFVNEKQKNARIDLEISKSYLNSWLAYTALQALRLPESNQHSIATAAPGKILTPLPQLQTQLQHQLNHQPKLQPPDSTPSGKQPPKSSSKSTKKQQQQQQQLLLQNSTQPTLQYKTSVPQLTSTPQKPPMHLVYIDPGNIITYSNRIYPQQVAEYKRKSHLLPSSATSKKSSAASYDVYEIMEVLANSNKTHVTITRNANRPSQAGTNTSIYSHSVNASTPGIVSTQLHLQAKSYLDIMGKFYAEEFARLEKEKEEMRREPSDEEMVRKYLKLDYPPFKSDGAKPLNYNCSESFDTNNGSNQKEEETCMYSEDLLESFEDEIKSMIGNYTTNTNNISQTASTSD